MTKARQSGIERRATTGRDGFWLRISRFWTSLWSRPRTAGPAVEAELAVSQPSGNGAPRSPGAEPSADDLVTQMLRQRRYALLLRPEIVRNLSPEQREAARDALQKHMSMVPQGEIRVGCQELGDEEKLASEPDPLDSEGRVVRVEAFLLDRTCVTNREFQAFVDAGGYEQMAFWEPQIWPGVLDFVDQTGYSGPRYWRHGRYPEGQDEHPVSGVSWFEAAAYARWCGKRLPTDPEWEKAAAWPSQMSATTKPSRRFPWGETLDKTRANLWLTNVGHTVPVDDFADGVSVGGIYQLIGNVWEWTAGNFGALASYDDELVLPTLLKSIRGGAFDTYFEAHATCQFQSGEDPTSRLPNIGFRCAVSFCDLSLDASDGDEPEEPADATAELYLPEEAPV